MSEIVFTAFRMNHPDLPAEDATKILIEAKKNGSVSMQDLERERKRVLDKDIL